MSVRQHAALAVNSVMTGLTIWAIGHVLRGPDARPSMPRDIGAGALVVAALLVIGWASTPEAAP